MSCNIILLSYWTCYMKAKDKQPKHEKLRTRALSLQFYNTMAIPLEDQLQRVFSWLHLSYLVLHVGKPCSIQ